MPPKAKTPSKGSAEENPQLNQVLAILQSTTAQIDGLSSRIDTTEKKSAAAEVAAIGGGDPKGQAQRSGRFLERKEQATSRREAYNWPKREGSSPHPAGTRIDVFSLRKTRTHG